LKPTNSPVVYNDVVYLGSGDGWIRGIDIDTGSQVWEVRATNKHISTPATIHEDVIYIGADDGHVYGFDLATKAKVFDVNVNTSAIFAPPTIADGMLFIGTLGKNLLDARFYGIDIGTQNISWTHDMGGGINIYGFSGSPSYDSGRVYIGDGLRNMYCFDADGFIDGNDGDYTSEVNTTVGHADIIWTYDASSSIIGSPMLAEGKVFFGNDIGDFFALDSSDGSIVWSRRMGAGEPPSIQASPSYLDGTVYVAAQRVWGPYNENKGGSIHAVDPSTGGQKWRFNVTGQMLKSSPVITDQGLLFAAGAGNTSVFCISTVTENIADEDRVLWYFNTRAPIWSALSVADGRVFACRPDTQGATGKLYAFGSPEPRVVEISMSDPSPYIGEIVQIKTLIENNATVDVKVDIQFKASTYDNQKQALVGNIEGIPIKAFSSEVVTVEWIVEMGYDMLVVFITDTSPEDEDKTNNFGTMDLSFNQMLTEGWLSAGSGPGKEGHSGGRLDSNRTYWQMSLEGEWQGPAEDGFYNGFMGNGTISAAGGNLYMAAPDGSLMAIDSTPGISGSPEILWNYQNSSVDFLGRPLLMVDRDMTLGGPNKVFAFGDDGALWAFDWAGFIDSRNDGPFIAEEDTSAQAGDVIWRTNLPGYPAQPLFISGGNILVPLLDGSLAAYDDDTGEQVWRRSVASPHGPYAADMRSIFTFLGSGMVEIDPYTGSIRNSYDLASHLEGYPVNSLTYQDETVLIVHNDTVSLFDAYPDDDGDGDVDMDDEDLGVEDNGTGYDMIWTVSYGSPVRSTPAVSMVHGTFGVETGSTLYVHFLGNGTLSSNIDLGGEVFGRIISGGDSYYLFQGEGPWTLSAFSPDDTGMHTLSWNNILMSEPRGEGAILGDNMFVSTRDGMVKAIGAENSPPVAVISSPNDGVLLFPGESVVFDASTSFDPEDDPLTYAWYLEGESEPFYQGQDEIIATGIIGLGRTSLILRVFDDMKAVGEDRINITLLKRITSPDHIDYLNDIYVHMSFGISEPSGAYIINSTISEEVPNVPGAVFIANLDFTPLPKYAEYRFEWANVSIGSLGREFQIGMHRNMLRMYYFDEDLDQWTLAPFSGVDVESGLVWGNFSDLRNGLYAIGILDNSIPEFRHIPDRYVFKPEDSKNYRFRVEYRDEDGDIPVYIKLVIDNQTEMELEVEGVQGSVTRFTYYSVTGVVLSAEWHSYFFEADDGNFIVRSPYYTKEIDNSPPEAKIVWHGRLVTVGEKVQFSAESSDPNGDPLTYAWDFDYDGGIFDRDALGNPVSHEFYSSGVYNVTLKISDGKDDTYVTAIVTVKDEGRDEDPPPWWLLALVTVLAVLIIAVVAFIVLSKKGHEEEDEVTRLAEEAWNCPECGRTLSRAVDECPACGYEYDPLDFEDESDEM
jgi:outer membrane protein assembly factor BamB